MLVWRKGRDVSPGEWSRANSNSKWSGFPSNVNLHCIRKGGGTMNTSIIIAFVAIAAVLIWMILSRKKERNHLDKLHISLKDRVQQLEDDNPK